MTIENRARQVMSRADKLAQFSAAASGLTRAYLTREHRQAHDQLECWMAQAGLKTWQDSVGNQWGRRVCANPSAPTLIIGSHSDTVANAGKYDGNLGILLAIEALEVLGNAELPFHVDVVAFADEEGTRFNTTLIGSSAAAGCFQPAWLEIKDSSGVSMGEAMRTFGLQPERAGSDARSRQDTLAYLEVHIEQGPVLESHNQPVGIVTGIAGAQRYLLKVRGVAGHAGTVPHELRQDALCGAAQMIAAIERYAMEHGIVATVGKCDVVEGAVNVIPSEVHFSLDIRSQCQDALNACSQALLAQLDAIAEERQLVLEHERVYQANAVHCSQRLQQLWAGITEQHTGRSACFLSSGAGHDAMVMADLTEMGMLFVRCEKGISHNPLERVIESDVAVALRCLIDMVKGLPAWRSAI